MTTTVGLPPVEAPILTRLKELVNQLWQVDQLCLGPDGQPRPYPHFNLLGPLATDEQKSKGQEWLTETLAGLLDTANGNVTELSRQAALLYFRPFGWISTYTYDFNLPEIDRYKSLARGEIMQTVLSQWLRLHPTTASRALLAERIGTLLRSGGAKWKPDLYPPTLLDCLRVLLADESKQAVTLIAQLVVGEMGQARSRTVEEPELRKATPALYLRLWQSGQFDYNTFSRSMHALPGAFHDLSRPLEKNPSFYRTLPVGFSLQLQSFALQLTTKLAENLPTGDRAEATLLKQVGYLEGSSWLLLACAYLEEMGLSKLPTLRSTQPAAAATRLCHTHRPFNQIEDEDAHTIEFLRHYQPATLRAILPHVTDYRDLVEQALQ